VNFAVIRKQLLLNNQQTTSPGQQACITIAKKFDEAPVCGNPKEWHGA
jgi:hypothetical protein